MAHDNDRKGGTPSPWDGPPCPSDQLVTRQHCGYDPRCPWLVCRNGHVIRARDAHVAGERGEHRPDIRGAHAAYNDGAGDTRDYAFWQRVYQDNTDGRRRT